MPDAELIAVSIGDPEAFRPLFDRHFEAVRRYAAAGAGIDAADDVAAETFTIALRKRAAYQPMHQSALPWLLGIATLVVRERARGERRHARLIARLVPARAWEGGDESIERLDAQILSPRLVSALASLRDGDRDLVLLIVVAELTYAEAASSLGLPIGTVRSRLSRARARLALHFPERILDDRPSVR